MRNKVNKNKKINKINGKIILLINKHRLTREDIASFVGVTEKSVFRWENGRPAHRVFERKIDELFNREEIKFRNKQ